MRGVIARLNANVCTTKRRVRACFVFCMVMGGCLLVLIIKGFIGADSASGAPHDPNTAENQTLRLSIYPTKKVYRFSGPVDLQIQIANASSVTVLIPTFQSWALHGQNFLGAFVIEFIVYRLKGDQRVEIPLSRPLASYLDFPDPEPISLKPGMEWKTVVDLKKWWVPKDVGTYEVAAVWNIDPLVKVLGDGKFKNVHQKVTSEATVIKLAK